MDLIVKLPYVGPVILSVLKYVGVVGAIMTAISTGVMAVAKSLQAISMGLGFVDLANTIDGWYQKIFPIVGWLSLYNVSPKP